MTGQDLGKEFVCLALAIEGHLPGYVDAYFGPDEWKAESTQDGEIPLRDLTERVARLSNDVSEADDLDAQRRDFLARQLTAMQMSLRLLSGETVSLAEEVQALYDVSPQWKDESNFEQAHRDLDEVFPGSGSLHERRKAWKSSLEIPTNKVRELLPYIMDTLRERTRRKFDLPAGESFTVEFVSDQPWSAYNWYLGNARSRIDINTDLPMTIYTLPALIAHEAYPGHHTELSIKEQKLIREKGYVENYVNLINSPSCVVAEGIATAALETVFSDEELEDWFRSELLPRAGLAHRDARNIMAFFKATEKISGLSGNAAFMLHDQKKSAEEIIAYSQKYGLFSDKEAKQGMKFISNPLYRSYTFTYHVGYDMLKQLFAKKDRDTYFKRLLEEPVTPSQIQDWIDN
jgi:hypothetical protein